MFNAVPFPHNGTCDITENHYYTGPFILVIFGGAGDLSKRKLIPTVYNLFKKKYINDFYIIGFGLPELSENEYREFVKESINTYTKTTCEKECCDRFCTHFYYESADLGEDAPYISLNKKILQFAEKNDINNLIYYFAVPPQVVPTVIDKLSKHNLSEKNLSGKLVIEKPFGRDRQSAVELNNHILKRFTENQIFRMDHYLGKETVQNIIFFRFSNSIFEPLWNRNYIDHVQITVAEDLGVENRAVFYEKSGVIRDIVQNHMMQLIALVAMEPPVGFDPEFIRNEKVKVFNTIRPMAEDEIDNNTAFGQYGRGTINSVEVPGYREEKKVASDSIVPTFFSAEFLIDNWRWSGVPFFVRTGKRLKKRKSEIAIQFKLPPLKFHRESCDVFEPNTLVFGIQPHEEIFVDFKVKYPGAGNKPYPVKMDFNYDETFHQESPTAYERLLIDCMKGDLTLFARQDGIELMWSVVDPIIERIESHPPEKLQIYPAGSMGPKSADLLIEKNNRKWRIL